MKAQILKISGHKNEKDFYKEFPTMESFMAKHGAAFKKAQSGFSTDIDKNGVPDYLEQPNSNQPVPIGPQARFPKPALPQDEETDPSVLSGIQPYQKTDQDIINEREAVVNSTKVQPINKSSAPFDTGKAINTGISMLDSVINGVKALKEEKKEVKRTGAYKFSSGVQAKAAESVDVNRRNDIADTARRTRKALLPEADVDNLFPSYGVGTNVLAEHGGGLSRSKDYGSKSKPYPSVSSGDFAGGGRSYPIPTKADAVDALRLAGLHGRSDVKSKVYSKYPELRKGNHGEIINTYDPGTLYDDLGYEPLSDSDIVKAYKSGGLMMAQGGFNFGSMMGSSGPNPYSMIGNVAGSFLPNNGGAQIGEGIGEGIGSIFGPIGQVVGKFAGKAIGGGLDRNPRRIAANQAAINANNRRISGVDFSKNIHRQNYGSMEDGGFIDANPMVIKYLGNNNVKDLFKPDPTMDTLRTGGNIRQNNVGDIQALSGGHLEPISYNPYSDGDGVTSMIKGQTHEESNGKHTGVLLNYNKAEDGASLEPEVEAENNEPITEIGDSAVIYGDQLINERTVGNDPMFKGLQGKTFKKAMAGIAEQNQKLNKQQSKNTKAINDLDVRTPIDKLTLNSFSMNEKGIDTRYAANDAIMKKAAAYQEVVNQEAERLGINSGDYSRGKLTTNELSSAKNGKVIKAQAGFNEYDYNANKVPDYLETGDNRFTFGPRNKYKSKFDLVPWEGNVMPNNKYGKKTASTFSGEDWDVIAQRLGFKGKGNKEFQEFLLANPEAKPLIEARHAELYGTEPKIDEKLGYGWAPGELLKPQTPTTVTPLDVPPASTTTTQNKNYEVAPYQQYGWENIIPQVLPWLRRQPGEPLQADQLTGEMFALSSNQEEPVQARFYNPQLRTPYDISYQDQLNENQADFNQLVRAQGNNPEALAALAAQKYGANSKVLAEQFRANQAMKENVYSGNIQTLNDAMLKNLQIADQQYVRQATAKSATKAVKQEALNSISSKIAQNRLENRTLQTYANMFPDFSYDKSFRLRKTGAPTTFNMPVVYNAAGEVTHVAVYDDNGKIIDYKPVDSSEKPSTATPGIGDNRKKERNGGIVRAFKNL